MRDPEAAELRREGARAGGRHRSNAARFAKRLPETELTDEQLLGLIGTSLQETLEGEMSSGMGRAVAALARIYLDVRETRDAANRAQQMQERLNRQQEDRKQRLQLKQETEATLKRPSFR